METVLQRLNICASGGSIVPNRKLCRDAANEIARLTTELAEAREKNGALIEKVAQWLIDAGIAGDGEGDPLSTCIRALDPDATAALAALVKRVREEAFRNGHSRGRTGNFFNEDEDEDLANYLARLDQPRAESG